MLDSLEDCVPAKSCILYKTDQTGKIHASSSGLNGVGVEQKCKL